MVVSARYCLQSSVHTKHILLIRKERGENGERILKHKDRNRGCSSDVGEKHHYHSVNLYRHRWNHFLYRHWTYPIERALVIRRRPYKWNRFSRDDRWRCPVPIVDVSFFFFFLIVGGVSVSFFGGMIIIFDYFHQFNDVSLVGKSIPICFCS